MWKSKKCARSSQIQTIYFNNNKSFLMCSPQTNGVQGLFKGLVPRTLRRTLMAALSWTVYEQVCSSESSTVNLLNLSNASDLLVDHSTKFDSCIVFVACFYSRNKKLKEQHLLIPKGIHLIRENCLENSRNCLVGLIFITGICKSIGLDQTYYSFYILK